MKNRFMAPPQLKLYHFGISSFPKLSAQTGSGKTLHCCHPEFFAVILSLDTLPDAHDRQERTPMGKPEDGDWCVAPYRKRSSVSPARA
jgi:hypothetical protein